MDTETQNEVIRIVNIASEKWKTAFNSGDAEGCASCYEANAVVVSKPFGTFNGREAIKGLWEKIISNGFSDVQYIDPKITVLSSNSAVLSSKWKMNNAHGIITKELWIVSPDGTARLRDDFFEVTG